MSIRYLQTEISSLTSSRDSRSLISTFLSLFAEFGSLIISLKDDEIFTFLLVDVAIFTISFCLFLLADGMAIIISSTS